MIEETSDCPCCSGKTYQDCCQPYLNAEADAPTAEALMRSRYSAYVVPKIDYLSKTLVRKERRSFNRKETIEWATKSKWLGLEIVETERGGPEDKDGIVEFIATFEQKGEVQKHHERSLFRKVDGKWLYVTGEFKDN